MNVIARRTQRSKSDEAISQHHSRASFPRNDRNLSHSWLNFICSAEVHRLKKILLISMGLAILLVAGGYCLLRYHVLAARDFKRDPAKSIGPLDLNPSVIAKLQQLVKDGSDGLYLLHIGRINVDITGSEVRAELVSINVDSVVYKQMAAAGKLPDDIFRGRLGHLDITSLGIDDLLHQRDLTVGTIRIDQPELEVFHYKKKEEKKEDPVVTLQQRLSKQLDRLCIHSVILTQGSLTAHVIDKDTESIDQFRDINMNLVDILIDSTTMDDKNRFLFAKQGKINAGGYSQVTPDSNYTFSVKSISIDGPSHRVGINGLSLLPRKSREDFEKSQKTRKELYRLEIPSVKMAGVDWWNLVHHESFICNSLSLGGGSLSVYLDRSLPSDSGIKIDNYPQQMLATLPLQLNVRNLVTSGMSISYEEFNPETNLSGAVRFEELNGTISNVTNIPSVIKSKPVAIFQGSCRFMGQVAAEATINFWLGYGDAGRFTWDMKSGPISKDVVNPFAAALAVIKFTSGMLDSSSVHLEGDNLSCKGRMNMYYHDLHIQPLKKGTGKPKRFTAFLANALLIKNQNPGKNGEFRNPELTLARGDHGNLFNLAWSTMVACMMKVIGVPDQFSKK